MENDNKAFPKWIFFFFTFGVLVILGDLASAAEFYAETTMDRLGRNKQ